MGAWLSGGLVGAAAAVSTRILRDGQIAILRVAVDALGNALATSLVAASVDPIQSLEQQASTAATNRVGYSSGGSAIYGPNGNTSGIVSSETGGAFNADAAYAQIVDSFTRYSGGDAGYTAEGPALMLAASGRKPDTVTDAGPSGWEPDSDRLADLRDRAGDALKEGTYRGEEIVITLDDSPVGAEGSGYAYGGGGGSGGGDILSSISTGLSQSADEFTRGWRSESRDFGVSGLSLISCLRHNMSPRSDDASQTKNPTGRAADDPRRAA